MRKNRIVRWKTTRWQLRLANTAMAWAAAKRALREGAELYRMAEEQFDSVNNLERKIMALKKSARNIARLMEMK